MSSIDQGGGKRRACSAWIANLFLGRVATLAAIRRACAEDWPCLCAGPVFLLVQAIVTQVVVYFFRLLYAQQDGPGTQYNRDQKSCVRNSDDVHTPGSFLY
jgi:hypothetical protein